MSRRSEAKADQTELPDTQARIGDHLQRRANAPLKPSKPQRPMETGLFGDGHKQGEMF